MHDQSTHHEPSTGGAAGGGAAAAGAGGTASPASNPASNTGIDVMKILADVEGHLTRLRSAQKQQDDAISSVTARSRALRTAEDELDKQRQALKQQAQQVERERSAISHEREQFADQCKRIDEELRRRAAEIEQSRERLEREQGEIASHVEKAKTGLAEVEHAKTVWQQNRKQVEEQLQRSQGEIDQRFAECAKAKDEIGAARSAWEKQRQEAQGKLEARAAEVEKQVADIARREHALQTERDRVAAAELAAQRQQQELQRRATELEKQRGELLERVDQAERNVGDLIQQVERTQQDLTEQTRLVKSAMDKVASMQARERALEKAVEAAKNETKRAEGESRDLIRLADSERAEMQRQLESRQKEILEARDAAMAELENARKKIASLQRDVRTRDEEITVKEGQLADLQRKLEMAGGKLTEFAQVLSEQTPQLERGAAALAMVQEQAEQIDRLTKQLAELQLSSDPAEIQRRDQRITELTEALRQARGQNVGEQAVAEIEQRNAALQQQVQQLRLESQNAQIAAEEARTQLQAYVNSGAETQMKDVALAEHAAKVAALTAEIERLHSAAAVELEQKLSAATKRHQKELAEARGAESRGSEQTVRQLRQRVADLEAEVAQAKSQAAAAVAAGQAGGQGDGEGEYVNRLRAKAEQISSVAEHLRRRRARLERARLLMRQKQKAMPSVGAQGSAQMRMEQLTKMEHERQQLLEVRKMLATSESQMVHRWARQRAVFTLACVGVIVAVSAAATWLIVNQMFPAVVSASVVIEAHNRPATPELTPEQVQDWTDWHAGVVTDASFQQTLAKRMAERQLEQWSSPQAVAARLSKAKGFAVDADQPGLVMYTMAGADADEITTFLDVFAQTLVSESNRQANRRSDGANTIATGERKEEGHVHYASLNSLPVSDERLAHALPIFGIVCGALLVLVFVIYARLRQAKRIFDEDNAGLFQDLRPAST